MWLNKIQRTVEQSEDNTTTEEYGRILAICDKIRQRYGTRRVDGY